MAFATFLQEADFLCGVWRGAKVLHSLLSPLLAPPTCFSFHIFCSFRTACCDDRRKTQRRPRMCVYLRIPLRRSIRKRYCREYVAPFVTRGLSLLGTTEGCAEEEEDPFTRYMLRPCTSDINQHATHATNRRSKDKPPIRILS